MYHVNQITTKTGITREQLDQLSQLIKDDPTVLALLINNGVEKPDAPKRRKKRSTDNFDFRNLQEGYNKLLPKEKV
jgi:ketopantoate reductase